MIGKQLAPLTVEDVIAIGDGANLCGLATGGEGFDDLARLANPKSDAGKPSL